MKKSPFGVFRVLNKWMRNVLSASCLILRYSQPYAWLHQKGPHDHLPSSWGRDLVWYILKCLMCHSGIRKHSLCITPASCVPAPPFSSSTTPLSGQQSSGAVASCVAWHPNTLGNLPSMQRCLLSPQSCLVKGEKQACVHGEINFLYYFVLNEIVFLSPFLNKYLYLNKIWAAREW